MDVDLKIKLEKLSLMSSPSRNKAIKPMYLGDDEDHSMRHQLREAISPSPRQDEKRRAEQSKEALAEIADSYRNILHSIGEDPSRQGLLKTPVRAAKALLYYTKGYDEKIEGNK